MSEKLATLEKLSGGSCGGNEITVLAKGSFNSTSAATIATIDISDYPSEFTIFCGGSYERVIRNVNKDTGIMTDQWREGYSGRFITQLSNNNNTLTIKSPSNGLGVGAYYIINAIAIVN